MIQWQLQRPWLVVSDSSYELCIRRNAGWYLIVFQIWVCRKKENLLSPSHQRVYCHLHHQCCLRVCKEYDPHKNHTCFLYKMLWNKMLYDQILSSELKANTSLICFHQRRKVYSCLDVIHSLIPLYTVRCLRWLQGISPGSVCSLRCRLHGQASAFQVFNSSSSPCLLWPATGGEIFT